MPLLQFYTTLAENKVPKDFQLKTGQLLSQLLLDKTLDKIVIHLFTDQKIFAGSDPKDSKPKAYGILRSIGRVSADENRKTIASLTEHVNKELGISGDEFRLFFVDLDHDLVGVMGKICTDLGE